MTLRVKAHFDGRTFVPDGPVDLPLDQPVIVEAQFAESALTDTTAAAPGEARDRALLHFLGRPRNGPGLPEWAMDREHIYDADARTGSLA